MPAAESDLDVCVVLDALGPESRLRISDIAWEIGFAAGIVISTVVFEREQFENGPYSVSPLVRDDPQVRCNCMSGDNRQAPPRHCNEPEQALMRRQAGVMRGPVRRASVRARYDRSRSPGSSWLR